MANHDMGMTRPGGETLAEVVNGLGTVSPGKAAIYYQDEILSYGELLARTETVAKSLLAMGVRNGDRIGALLGNEPDWGVICLAAAKVGATFVPLNTWYKQQELAWTVRHCGLSLLITRDRYIKTNYIDLFSAMMPELA